MLSTNRILLFVATVILCGLLFGLELGLILLITAVVCYNSYEPFSNGNDLENHDDYLEDELEEECKLHREGSETSIKLNAVAAKKKEKKMSLWQPRKSAAASVRIAKPDPNSPKRLSNVNNPSARPPLRYTGSPFGKSTLRPDNNVNEDRENTSLWGNPYSPTAKRKPARPSHQSNTSAGPLLSSPFLPRVKRAIGVGEAALLQQQSHSPRRSNYGMSGGRVFSPQHKALPYPSASSPGLMPLVRLGRHEKPILNENNSNMVHSPVTVKIAAPSPRRLNYTSRPSLLQEDREGVIRRAPDKETVLSALREKSRKRGIQTQDESVSDVNDQQSKRRKQDDSTSSSSSMVSEPEFLAELPVNGYSNIPLHMAGMKRPATPTVDLDLHVSPSLDRIIKKAKKDTRNNSIVSSLSSSRRGMAKEMKEFQRGEKRKPEEANQSFEIEPISKQTRTDIQLPACSVTSTTVPEGRPQPRIPEKSKTLTDTPSQTVPPVTEEIKPPQSLKKKILCDAEQASQKVKKGVDIDFMSPRSKVMALDVTTNPEDYDRDPAAVRQRAVDMLADINGETNTTSDKDKLKNGSGFPVQNGQPTSLASSSASLFTTTAPTATTTSTSTIPGGSAPSTLTALLNTEDKTKTGSSSGGLLSSVLFSSSEETATTTSQIASTVAPVSSTSNIASVTTSTAAATVQNGAATNTAPQFSFKPVFPVASTSTTVAGTSQQGGINFAGAKTTASTAPSQASGTISTLAAGSATAAAPSAFSFGGATQSDATASAALGSSQPPLNFSSGATASTAVPQKSTANSAMFGFGQPSQPAASSTASAASSNSTAAPASAFSFGVASNPAKPSAAPAPFTFGQTPSTTQAATTQSTSVEFGAFQSTSTTAPSTNSSLFSFGSTQKPAATTTTSGLGAGGFGIATPATTAANSQVSGFGVSSTTASSQQTPGFAFGQSQPTTNATTQNTASNPATGGFLFGTTSATTQSSTQPSSGLFNFGSAPSTNSTPTAGLGFGSNSTTAQPSSTGGFNFNVAASNTTPFAQSTSKGSIFGGATTTSQSSTGAPAFGSQPASTAAATGSVFGSGGGNFSFGQSTAPAFGQTSTTGASAGFGSSAAATTTAPSTFQFGATNSAVQSSFGSSGPSSQASFGSSAPSFNFGTSSNNASSTGSAFGTKPSSSLPVPTFGQSSGSAFGSFGSQQTSSVFGGSQSQPAGSAPSFGQASSTSAFGSSSQGSFSFGQASNAAPATPVKGFDFTAAASGTPSLQFGSSGNQVSGFSTPNQKTPVMNFGSVTPGASTPAFGGGGFGAPAGGMFSVGSGTTAPRPRSRARRKGNKR